MLEGLGVPIRGSNLFEYVIVQISVVPAYGAGSGKEGRPGALRPSQDTPFSAVAAPYDVRRLEICD